MRRLRLISGVTGNKNKAEQCQSLCSTYSNITLSKVLLCVLLATQIEKANASLLPSNQRRIQKQPTPTPSASEAPLFEKPVIELKRPAPSPSPSFTTPLPPLIVRLPTASPSSSPSNTPCEVTSFSLINAKTDKVLVEEILSDDVFHEEDVGTALNVVANTVGHCEFVKFALNGNPKYNLENSEPFTIGGKRIEDDYVDFQLWDYQPGEQNLRATPFFVGDGGTVTAGGALESIFTIVSLKDTDYGVINLPSSEPSAIPSDIPTIHFSSMPSMPSDPPSFFPSTFPSSLPSIEPTLTPTSVSDSPTLFVTHSNLPSVMPSTTASPTLSVEPTITPSPSWTPTISVQPSESSFPTLTPSYSLGPSGLPSIGPSYSSMPSLLPSGLSSDEPSLSSIPSLVPTSMPSLVPSISPKPTRSQIPSSLPTISKKPTGQPSPAPSPPPSPEPSQYPSTLPSSLPSLYPSTLPSGLPSSSTLPTNFPTDIFSSMPTLIPSSSPSLLPTEECIDDATYVSPINNFTCKNHLGTDCTQWKHIGLNDDELAELIQSCPESCGIPCGTFHQVDMTFSYILSFLAEETIDDESQVGLEQLTLEYLQSFVAKENTNDDADFVLFHVNLASADTLLDRRLAINENIQVRLTFLLKGYVLDLTIEQLQQLLTQAVDSNEFTMAIRDSSYPLFDNAMASSMPPIIVVQEPVEKNGTSTAAIALSALAGVTLLSAAILALGYKVIKHTEREKEQPHLSLAPVKSKDSLRPLDTKQEVAAGGFHGDSRPSSSHPVLESPVGSAQTQPTTNVTGSLLELLRSFSGGDRSQDSGDSFGTAPMQQSSSSSGQEDDDEQSATKLDDGHPLAGIIPPMVVIDIENEDIERLETKPNFLYDEENGNVPCGVPVRHFEASDTLKESLMKPHYNPIYMTMNDMLYDYDNASCPRHEEVAVRGNTGAEENGGDPAEDIVSARKVNEDSSIASMPVKSSAPCVASPIRKSQSLESSDPKCKNDGFASIKIEDFLHNKRDGVEFEKTVAPFQAREGGEEAVAEKLSDSRKPPMHRHTKSLSKADDFMVKGKKRRHRPLHHSFDGNVDNTLLEVFDESISTKESSSVLKNDSRSLSRCSSLSSCDRSVNSKRITLPETTHSFGVPCHGKLGLIIESSLSDGPTIHTVKNYSPLYGMVKAGDKIIEVDGVETKEMSTGQVTRLLARKKGERGNGKVKIIVSRLSKEQERVDTESFGGGIKPPLVDISPSHGPKRLDSFLRMAEAKPPIIEENQGIHLIGGDDTEDDEGTDFYFSKA